MTGDADDLSGIDVWYRPTDDLVADDIMPMLDILSEDERQRADRFHFAADRRDYVAAHALLRSALSGLTDRPPQHLQFVRGPYGKPQLAPGQPPHQVSLSHTRGLVACAITRAGSVGVDAEIIDPSLDVEQIASHTFSNREIEALAGWPPDRRHALFATLWTLKEAYVKATGTGLAGGLADFSIILEGERGLALHPPADETGHVWQLATFAPTQCHCLAVAVRSTAMLDYSVRSWSSGPRQAALSPIRTLPVA